MAYPLQFVGRHHPRLERRHFGPLLQRALAVWVGMLVVMTANGAVRRGLLERWWAEPVSNQISVLIGATLLLHITAIAWRWLAVPSAAAGWAVGTMWLGLTLAFEFGFMHFIAGASWARLLAEYEMLNGRLWPLVLLTTLVAPAVVGSLRGYSAQPSCVAPSATPRIRT